jgi:hypothetical protein
MKIKRMISVFILCLGVFITGCASLRPSAANEPALGADEQKKKCPTPDEEAALGILYYVVYIVGSAFGGR